MRGFTRPSGHSDQAAEAHLVFAWSPQGYRLHERSGEPPPAGSEIDADADGYRLRVVRVGVSPLPGDQRRCAFTVEASDEPRAR